MQQVQNTDAIQGIQIGEASGLSTLWKANEQFFTVLFWFALFGPFAGFLYRLVNWSRQLAEKGEGSAGCLSLEITMLCQGILEWLPARLVALGYALMSTRYIKVTLAYWVDNLATSFQMNKQLLSQCGALALGLTETEGSIAPGGDAAQVLVNKVLWLFVAVVALFTVASLLM